MANAKSKAPESNEIQIMQVNQGAIEFCLVGTSPLLYNAMSEKAWHELLYPSPKKNAAEKQSSMKHDPPSEFRNSTYHHTEDTAATRLNFPSAAFKKALASAALDIPGAAKAQIGRLVWAQGQRVDMYGIPQLSCMIVRMADMNRTPDVRTRAILPEWACRVSMRFMEPILKAQTITNLFAAAGFICGIGDGRQQKGSLSYGQFRLCGLDDPDYVRITTSMGRVPQDAALAEPSYYDEETERLMLWFKAEVVKRDGRNGRPVHNTNGAAKAASLPLPPDAEV